MSLLGRCALAVSLVAASGCGEDIRPTGDAGGRIDGGPVITADGATPEDGGGSSIDAGPEPCETPGATETVACGTCGTTTRFCTVAGVWAYGPCTGESGACVPGAERAGACGRCGTQTQRCNTSCEWESAGACTGEGGCAPGSSVRTSEGCPAGQAREALCDESCMPDDSGTCGDDSCPTPGASETVACGRCGSATRFCDASRQWQYDPCTGEGVCTPGTTDVLACGNCGTQTARCNTECTWIAGSACTGEGECAPGTSMISTMGCSAGQSRTRTCSDTCGYVDGPCAACTPGAMMTVACGTCRS